MNNKIKIMISQPMRVKANEEIAKLQKENEEKDKQIDLMAEHIHITGEYNCLNIKCEDNGSITCEDCIKQYFETKAKKGE